MTGNEAEMVRIRALELACDVHGVKSIERYADVNNGRDEILKTAKRYEEYILNGHI